jgi:EmrB/QacA subfamily drug resistance transporter
MLLGGRAGDLYGRKRMFLVGLGLFTAASLAGGLAQEPWQLITARALQGLGAAVLSPATLTILTTSFPEGPARARAIGTWTAVGAGGGAAGALVGGVLTDALSWRWVLLINVPIGVVVLLAAALRVRESRAGDGRRLDALGAVLVTAGLSAVAYGIVQTEAEGWSAAAALVPLIGGLVVLGLFVAVEAGAKAPLMPLALFRLRSVWAANTTMFVWGAAAFSAWYFMSLYMQNVLHYSALKTGLGFIPQSLVIVLGSKIAPRLMAWTGPRNLAAAGMLMTFGGFLWQSAVMAPDSGYAASVLGPGILMMFGAGCAATPLVSVATSGVAAADAGLVSGLANTSRMMGGSLGLSILATASTARIDGGTAPHALAEGYALAFRIGSLILVGCVALMLFALPRERRAADG